LQAIGDAPALCPEDRLYGSYDSVNTEQGQTTGDDPEMATIQRSMVNRRYQGLARFRTPPARKASWRFGMKRDTFLLPGSQEPLTTEQLPSSRRYSLNSWMLAETGWHASPSTPLGCSRDSIGRYVRVLADRPRDGFRTPLGTGFGRYLLMSGRYRSARRQSRTRQLVRSAIDENGGPRT
jgi:hypothetical protein